MPSPITSNPILLIDGESLKILTPLLLNCKISANSARTQNDLKFFKGKIYFGNSAKVNISFLFPRTNNMSYVVSSGQGGLSYSELGQSILLPMNNNGHYNVTILVTGYHCVNRTFVTTITVNKFFDLSNTGLVLVVGALIAVPGVIMASSVQKTSFIILSKSLIITKNFFRNTFPRIFLKLLIIFIY